MPVKVKGETTLEPYSHKDSAYLKIAFINGLFVFKDGMIAFDNPVEVLENYKLDWDNALTRLTKNDLKEVEYWFNTIKGELNG